MKKTVTLLLSIFTLFCCTHQEKERDKTLLKQDIEAIYRAGLRNYLPKRNMNESPITFSNFVWINSFYETNDIGFARSTDKKTLLSTDNMTDIVITSFSFLDSAKFMSTHTQDSVVESSGGWGLKDYISQAFGEEVLGYIHLSKPIISHDEATFNYIWWSSPKGGWEAQVNCVKENGSWQCESWDKLLMW